MSILFLLITMVASTMQGVFKKHINARCQNCEFTVSVMITGAALVFFLLCSGDLAVPAALFPYCIGLSVCYACAAVTYVLAIACGSLALTQLILSYSCIIPLGYSLICGETLGLLQLVGVAFLFTSLVVTYYRKRKPDEKQAFSVKWVVYITLMTVSNGFCGVFMRMQQLQFGGVYDNPFMVYSLILAVLILAAAAAVRERGRMFYAFKRGILLSAACGASNGLTNYFGLICLSMIPNSIYYPVRSAGELILTSLISIFLFKEKLRPAQYVGIGLGVLALVFINIK